MGQEGSKGEDATPSQIFAIVIVVILFVGSFGAALIFVNSSIAEPGSRFVLKTGDYFRYRVTGSNESAPISTFAQMNLTFYQSNGYLTTYSTGGYSGPLPQAASKWISYALDRHGMVVDTELIHTDFGAKKVTKTIFFEEPSFLIQYAGIESEIVYRLDISGPSCYVSLDLEETNATGIQVMDHPAYNKDLHAMYTTDNYIATKSSPPVVATILVIRDERFDLHLATTLSGNVSLVAFTDDDIQAMTEGGYLRVNETLSINGLGESSSIIEADEVVLVQLDCTKVEAEGWGGIELRINPV